MRRCVSVLALVALLLSNCTTKLINTSSEYRPVTPERARLSCTCDLPATYSSPVLKVALWKQVLTEKVETRHYRTDYSWLNRSLWLGLAGFSGYAAAHWWNYYDMKNDTAIYTRRVLGLVGAGIGLLGAWSLSNFPIGPSQSREQRVFSGDTVYGTGTQLANRAVQVTVRQQGAASVTQQTDDVGRLILSARDYYDLPEADKGLMLDIAGAGLSATLSVPGAYLMRAGAYDSAAVALFGQARKAEEDGHDEEALSFYSRVADTYPDATAAPEARAKAQTIQQRVQAAKVARVRDELRRVSDDKVRSAIAALGLSRDESDYLGRAVDGLKDDKDKAGDVIRVGLDMPLSGGDCAQEYRGLTLFQKFYAVLCYQNRQGGDVVQGYMSLLGVSESVARRLAGMDPKTMLK